MIRDRSLPIADLTRDELAQGNDLYPMTVYYQDSSKKMVTENVAMSWDEIFSVIGPTMYGYIMRRGSPSYNQLVGQYPFEGGLIQYIRSKIMDRCGTRQVTLLPHQIDTVLIQFRQLGLMKYEEKAHADGEEFRGYSLTEAGETHLTKLKSQLRLAAE